LFRFSGNFKAKNKKQEVRSINKLKICYLEAWDDKAPS